MAVRFRTKALLAFYGVMLLLSLVAIGGVFALGSHLGVGSDPFVVAVEDHDEARDVTPVVRDAVAYWNENGDRYPSAYRKRLVLEADASDPDVLVRYRPSVSCETDGAAGCAPLPASKRDAESFEKPMVVRVDASRTKNRLTTRRALIHEFGHVLSVSHCEEPRERMGCPRSSGLAGPAWTDRRYPFNTTDLRVHVDAGDASPEMEAAVEEVLEDASAGEVDGVPPAVTFRRVDGRWNAHVTVRVTECSGCRGGSSAALHGGPPYSPALRYASYAEVTITAEDADGVEARLPAYLERYGGNESKPRRPAP